MKARHLACLALILVTTAGSFGEAAGKEPPSRDGFVSLFDGRSLDGWAVVPKNTDDDWKVSDGVIVGGGTADRLSYLVWKERDLKDFELRFQYRMLTDGNTGVEVRAHPDKTGKRPFEGYHADLGHIGIGPNILGAWDFHFAKRREHPCPRGTRLTINADQTASSEEIDDPLTLDHIRKRGWNEVRVIARGNRCQFFINRRLSAEFTDNAASGQLKQGAIGFQLHDKGMRVEFKDVELKKLSRSD